MKFLKWFFCKIDQPIISPSTGKCSSCKKTHHIDKLIEQLKEGKKQLEWECLIYGHEFRNDVFEMGDVICVRCGKNDHDAPKTIMDYYV